METIAILLMVTGAFIYAGGITAQRKLQLEVLTPRGAIVVGGLVRVSLFLVLTPWWDKFTFSIGLPTPAAPNRFMFWIGVFWATGWNTFIEYANAKARDMAPNSLTQPYQGMTPLLITVSMLAFLEYPSEVAVMGIVCVGVFTYLHGREGARTLKEWLLPLQALFILLPKEEIHLIQNRPIGWKISLFSHKQNFLPRIIFHPVSILCPNIS